MASKSAKDKNTVAHMKNWEARCNLEASAAGTWGKRWGCVFDANMSVGDHTETNEEKARGYLLAPNQSAARDTVIIMSAAIMVLHRGWPLRVLGRGKLLLSRAAQRLPFLAARTSLLT